MSGLLKFKTDDFVVNCNQGSGYFSVVSLDGLLHLFGRRDRNYDFSIHLAGASNEELVASHPVLTNSSACHNFSVFKDKNGMPFALGGQNSDIDLPHSEGLYQFQTENGYEFSGGELVVGGGHPGLTNARELWGIPGDIDAPPSCVFCDINQRYYVFLRANPERGVRRIQYAVGQEINALGAFNILDERYIRRDKDDFFYAPCFYFLDRLFFGILPVVNPRYTSLRLIASLNGVDWFACQDFFPKKPWFNEAGDPKPCDFPVQGVLVEEDTLSFYFHHNFLRGESDGRVFLSCKTISRTQLIRFCKQQLSDVRWVRVRRSILRYVKNVLLLRKFEGFDLRRP